MLQFGNPNLNIFAFLQLTLHWLDENAFPRIPPSSASSGGGADGGPSHVCLSRGGVRPGAGGALFLTHSGTALTGVLLGADIDWTGVVSMLAFRSLGCSRCSATLSPRIWKPFGSATRQIRNQKPKDPTSISETERSNPHTVSTKKLKKKKKNKTKNEKHKKNEKSQYRI